jgi:hypothetical protein
MFRRSLGSSVLTLVSVGFRACRHPIDLTTSNDDRCCGRSGLGAVHLRAHRTGNYQPFERLQDNGTEEVHNDLNLAARHRPRLTRSIQMVTLSTFTSVGGAIPAGTYYVFGLDINEPNSTKDRLPDEFQLSPTTRRTQRTYADLAMNATLKYDMDGFGNDHGVKLTTRSKR